MNIIRSGFAECPYCGELDEESGHLEGGHYDSGDAECSRCGKEYAWAREWTVEYRTEKKD